MKHLQIRLPAGSVGPSLFKALDFYKSDFTIPLERVFAESFIYLRDIAVKNLTYRLKKPSLVTLIVPSRFLKQKVFELQQDQIVFQDEDIIVFNKPSGLPTQPTLKPMEDHLYGAAIAHFTERKPQKLAYIGLHHRLDRETSGLVLMTRRPSANKSIAEQFQQHRIGKKYLAFAIGKKPEQALWTVDAPIGRVNNFRGGFKFGIDHKKGDSAITHFKYLKSVTETCHLIECEPVTGRTHQIRIHLQASKLPILGDRVYGKAVESRLMLHASEIRFVHPKKQEKMQFSQAENFLNLEKECLSF